MMITIIFVIENIYDEHFFKDVKVYPSYLIKFDDDQMTEWNLDNKVNFGKLHKIL